MAQFWTIITNLYSIAGPCVMLLYPLYASVEAIESSSKEEDEQWLAYWIIYSFLTLFEMVAEPLLSWIPIWYTVKLIFVMWLVLPQLRGSTFIYKFVRKQLRLYGYGGHNANKKVINPSSPSKGTNKILGLSHLKEKLKIIEGGASADEIRVCTICNVVCNSAKVFASHLAGKKHALKALGPNYHTMAMTPKVMTHIKQMKDANKLVLEALNKRAGLGYIAPPKTVEAFSCEVCKVECNSQKTLNTHRMGKKHKENLQKLQENITPKPSATSAEKMISACQDQTAKVEAVKKPSSTKEDYLQTKKDKVVQGGAAPEVLGPNYHTMTMAPKVMTLKQMKDAKKLVPEALNKRAGLGYIAPPKTVEAFSCEVCKVECNSQKTLNIHRMGKKHKANLQKLQENITPKPSATSAEKMISAGQDQTAKVEAVKKLSSTKEDYLQTKKDKVVQGGAAPEVIMVCVLCDVRCNRKAVFDSHMAGKKHLSMIKKQVTRA